MLRYLLRLNAEKGSAKKADIPGYQVGGKTGTAEKVINGRYASDRLFTTFMAVFPFDKPKYLVLCLYDEPKGLPETYGFATAAWNAGRHHRQGRRARRAAARHGAAFPGDPQSRRRRSTRPTRSRQPRHDPSDP